MHSFFSLFKGIELSMTIFSKRVVFFSTARKAGHTLNKFKFFSTAKRGPQRSEDHHSLPLVTEGCKSLTEASACRKADAVLTAIVCKHKALWSLWCWAAKPHTLCSEAVAAQWSLGSIFVRQPKKKALRAWVGYAAARPEGALWAEGPPNFFHKRPHTL